jgi:hypothetical protein
MGGHTTQPAIVMKTSKATHGTGILTTISLLAGLWLLSSCATEPIELARGTHWRDAAKVAGQPTTKFSYQMNGRKYDRVTFAKMDRFPVVLENGRVFSVDFSDFNWYRHFSECMTAGELPFDNGLGPLHSLVEEQGKRFQREGWPPEPEHHMTAGAVALAPLALAGAPLAVPVIAIALLVPLPVYAATGASRRRAQDVNNALLDSDVSYANFIEMLGKLESKTSKGSYSANIYWATEGITQTDYSYQVGIKNGKVVWVAYQGNDIIAKIYEYRKAHGLR